MPPDPQRPTPTTRDVAAQFSTQARAYAVSHLHRHGFGRLLLVEKLEPVSDEILLDVGTGPGPVAFTFAPHVARVVGFDAAQPMLAAARLAARRDQVANAEWVAGDAHDLPFPDRAFHLVTARACPHHFADLRQAVAEMARVLRRGGRLGIVDGTVPEDDALDRFINELDTLHDPTTVRNYRPSEWRAVVEGAGLRLDWIDGQVYELDEGMRLSEWMARSGASTAVYEEARRRLIEAPEPVRRFLRVRPEDDDVRFALPRAALRATRTT